MNSGNTTLHAVLLAGGRSERMGSDKCLIDWHGTPLWQHQLATLRALNPAAIHVAAPTRPHWLPVDVRWCKDSHDNAGPLSGLHAALVAAQPALLVALAIDLPDMTAAYFSELIALCNGDTGRVPKSQNGFEPLAAIYPSSLADSANTWLSHGNRGLQGWLEELCEEGSMQSIPVTREQTALFLNLNHPSDLTAS